MKNRLPFSVLMSVYKKEKPDFLQTSIESILTQTVSPDEIVIVKDGPLTADLEDVLKAYCDRYNGILKIVPIKENVMLGRALNIGLSSCANELVARMDSDDISVRERFQVQTAYMNEHPEIHVLGSWISEFEVNPDQPYSVRKVALKPDEIRKTARFRNPMNHMTVMFKKSSVLSVGNYQHFLWFEDYHLWARLLSRGFQFANLPLPLVNVRSGNAMIEKRSGVKYFKQEFMLQRELMRMGFIGKLVFLFNVLCRGLARILPKSLLLMVYRTYLRESLSLPIGNKKRIKESH